MKKLKHFKTVPQTLDYIERELIATLADDAQNNPDMVKDVAF